MAADGPGAADDHVADGGAVAAEIRCLEDLKLMGQPALIDELDDVAVGIKGHGPVRQGLIGNPNVHRMSADFGTSRWTRAGKRLARVVKSL